MLNKENGTFTTCAECDAGQFQEIPGIETCNDCPVGYSQDEIGIPYCVGCIPGQFQDEKGQQQCQECPAGQKRSKTDTNSTKCVDCPTGQVMSTPGAAKCIDCVPGRYQAVENNDECKKCPIGWSTKDPAIVVNEEGNSNTDSNEHVKDHCIRCERGKHTSNRWGAAQCDICPPGSLGQQMTAATAGDPDSYNAAPVINGIKIPGSVCVKCISGTFLEEQFVDPATVDDPIPSMMANLSRTCKVCPLGFQQQNEGSTFCLPCLTGTFQNVTGSSSCKHCPIGFRNGETEKDSCTSCPKGTFQNLAGAANCQGTVMFCKMIDLFWT